MRAGFFLLSGLLALAACSSDDDDGGASGSSGKGGSAASGAGGSAGSAGKGQGGSAGAAGSVLVGGQGGEQGCATASASAEAREVDLYIMLDQSGSMTEPAGATSKWLAVKTALLQFFSDPSYDNTGAGIQFFPLGLGDAACTPAQYASPAIAIQPLKDSRTSLYSTLDQHSPVIGGETPTRPALQGAVSYARSWAKEHPERVAVVVLATDGKPTICGTDQDQISLKATEGFDASPRVLTFVIGVGSGFDDVLNAIAKAGGSDKATKIDVTGDVSLQFKQALDAIRSEAVQCDFVIPPPSSGDLDFSKVNVRYASPGGEVDFYAVSSSDKCAKLDNAWYYDDPKAPTRIVLCPSACDRARQASSVKIDIVFGCKTQIVE